MDRIELARKIYQVSYLQGTFKLRSGQISHEYFDKYLFESDPELLRAIAARMRPLIPKDTEVLAGLEMGGIPIATALSLETGLPLLLVRKKAKDYGTCKVAEGQDHGGKKVCVIEDVVTTGGQIILSTQDLRKSGAVVTHVMCVILRNEEGRANLKQEGLELIPLYSMKELKET
ncbi:MAG: orotate phosphoribosyltransferase [Bacteroidota bacterium]